MPINWKSAARAFFRRAEAKQRHLNNIEAVIASVRDEERGGYFESWRDAARHWNEATKREREKSAKLEDQLFKTTDDAYQLQCMREAYNKLFTAVQEYLGTKDPDLDDVLKLLKATKHDDYDKFCERIGHVVAIDDNGMFCSPDVDTMVDSWMCMRARSEVLEDFNIVYYKAEWDDYFGDALWWKFPVTEPPYAGSPLDEDFPDYVTHFTRIFVPTEPVHE